MPQFPKYQQAALDALRVRLSPDDPANNTSDEVKEHLRAVRPWLQSWVLPLIDAIESSNDYGERWQREFALSEGRKMAARRAELRTPPPTKTTQSG